LGVSLADGDSRPLQAVYRDGLPHTVTAPKANKVSSVTVQVEG
jgi:hypothetical protein